MREGRKEGGRSWRRFDGSDGAGGVKVEREAGDLTEEPQGKNKPCPWLLFSFL